MYISNNEMEQMVSKKLPVIEEIKVIFLWLMFQKSAAKFKAPKHSNQNHDEWDADF